MKDDLAKTIGERIRTKRGENNINQKELAESIGITPAAINQFEKGEKKPSAGILAKIANALGVSADYLLGASDDEDIFRSENVAAAFRDFKELSPKDREIILSHIELLISRGKQVK